MPKPVEKRSRNLKKLGGLLLKSSVRQRTGQSLENLAAATESIVENARALTRQHSQQL